MRRVGGLGVSCLLPWRRGQCLIADGGYAIDDMFAFGGFSVQLRGGCFLGASFRGDSFSAIDICRIRGGRVGPGVIVDQDSNGEVQLPSLTPHRSMVFRSSK